MARVWSAGFEFNSATANMEFSAVTGSPTIVQTVVRSGEYAGRISTLVSGTAQIFSYQFSSADASGPYFFRVYIRVATRPSAGNSVIRINSSTSVGILRILLNSDGTLTLRDEDGVIGSNSPALNNDQWYRVEFQVDMTGAAGSHVVRALLDGNEFAGASNRDLSVGIRELRVGGNLAGEAHTVGDWYFDDLAINDTTSPGPTGYPGSGKLVRSNTNASGDANSFATQTGGTAGGANNFTRVSEVTPDDATTFNGSSTLNQEDLFNVNNNYISSLDYITLVHVFGRFRNSTADNTAAIKFEIEKTASGTITQSNAIVPNTTTWSTNATANPRVPVLTLYTDPDGANWTKSTIDSMQIGYKLTTGPGTAGRRIDVSNVHALIEYIPAVDIEASFSNTGNGVNSYNITVSTPGPNRELLFAGHASQDASTVANITGGSLTWVKVDSLAFTTNNGNFEVWRTFAPAQLSSTVFTISFNGASFPQCSGVIDVIAGMNTSGSNGSGAIGATAKNTTTGTSPSQSVVTTKANSLVWAGIGTVSNATITPGTNQKLAGDSGAGPGFSRAAVIRQNSQTDAASTTVTMSATMGSSVQYGIIVVELLPAVFPQSIRVMQAVNRAGRY